MDGKTEHQSNEQIRGEDFAQCEVAAKWKVMQSNWK